MEDSPILLIQEVDVIKVIVRERRYSENEDILKIRLTKFEGKHFRQLTPEQTPDRFLERVEEILRKFEKLDLVNEVILPDIQNFSLSSIVEIDIKNKVGSLKQYGKGTENKVIKMKGNKQVKNVNSSENLHPKFLIKIPNNKQTRKGVRQMAKILEQNGIGMHVENYLLLQCVDQNATLASYRGSQKKNNGIIGYRFRSLNRYLKPMGLKVHRRFHYSYLAYIEN